MRFIELVNYSSFAIIALVCILGDITLLVGVALGYGVFGAICILLGLLYGYLILNVEFIAWFHMIFSLFGCSLTIIFLLNYYLAGLAILLTLCIAFESYKQLENEEQVEGEQRRNKIIHQIQQLIFKILWNDFKKNL